MISPLSVKLGLLSMRDLISGSKYRWCRYLSLVRISIQITIFHGGENADNILLGPDDILIRLNFTGLCSSDIHMMKGDLGVPPMSTFGVRSPGHEGAGIVVKAGANVKNFKLGDRAGIKPITDTCASCAMCWDDKETYCSAAIHTGLMTPGEYNQTNS